LKPRFDAGGVKKAKPWEYAVRFVFGGAVAALAGFVAKTWGPVVGGLFLAFPAILPASLTLVKQHDGRKQALDDARGGRLGSVGLIGFAVTVWTAAEAWPPWAVLVVATVVWLVVNGVLWAVFYGRE
jgi:uncharacterized membrane protein (GlpM family)